MTQCGWPAVLMRATFDAVCLEIGLLWAVPSWQQADYIFDKLNQGMDMQICPAAPPE